MCSKDLWSVSMRPSSGAAGRRECRQVPGVEDSYRVRRMGQGDAGLALLAQGIWRRGDDGHGRKVLGLGMGPVLVVGVVEGHAW